MDTITFRENEHHKDTNWTYWMTQTHTVAPGANKTLCGIDLQGKQYWTAKAVTCQKCREIEKGMLV